MVRVDLHSHTRVSLDAWIAPDQIVPRAIHAGLDHIAITDHDRIDAALELHAKYPQHVIVAEEMKCADGTDLIGLFIAHHIPSGLTVAETAERVREQGGLVYAPHPFAYATYPKLHARMILEVADVVEVFNSRAFLPRWNRLAMLAAKEHGLAVAASSDAHFSRELGRAYTEMPAFSGAEEFRKSVAVGKPIGRSLGSPWLHVASTLLATARRLSVRGNPEPVMEKTNLSNRYATNPRDRLEPRRR